MPYGSNSELPESVRSKYSDRCQRAYRHAFNSVYEDTHDDGRSAAAGHTAAQRCEGSKSMAERPFDFRIYTGILRAARDAEGRKVFRGVASSTTRDLHGDVMELSAIEDMERSARENNLTLFLNHEYKVPEDVAGTITFAKISPRGADHDGQTNFDLDIEGTINEANPRALQTFAAIEGGTKLGISIGAFVPDGGAVRDKKTGAYRISHVDLREASFVGIPANPRSWVEYAVKSLRARDSEIPDDTEEETTIAVDGPAPEVIELGEDGPEMAVLETAPDDSDVEEEDDSQGARKKKSNPENEDGLLDETADGDDERLGDTVTNAASTDTDVLATAETTTLATGDWVTIPYTGTTITTSNTYSPHDQRLMADLAKTTSELVDTKKALLDARAEIAVLERDRAEALAQRDRVLELTAQTLDKIARLPLPRKTYFVEADTEFKRRMAAIYPEGFLKLMEDRS